MFSITARFRKSRTEGVAGAVYYVIREGSAERNVTSVVRGADERVLLTARRQIVCDLKSFYCVTEHLSESRGQVTLDEVADESRRLFAGDNPYLDRIRSCGEHFPIKSDIATVGRDFRDDFEPQAPRPEDSDRSLLLGYIDSLIAGYRLQGKGFANTLRSLRLSLSGFLGGAEVHVSEVSPDLIMDYSRYLQGRRVAPSTVSFYLRGLRSVLNQAREAGLTDLEFNWPANVDISVDHSQKNTRMKSLDAAMIRKIADADLSSEGNLAFVRDVFMFCFYAHGLELVDVANLRVENLRGDVLSYRRRLKGKAVEVKLGEKAMAIVRRYAEAGNPYIFPMLQRKGKAYSFTYVRDEFSKAMKRIGHAVVSPVSLTFGMSRYSWLAIMAASNVAEMIV